MLLMAFHKIYIFRSSFEQLGLDLSSIIILVNDIILNARAAYPIFKGNLITVLGLVVYRILKVVDLIIIN